MGRVHSFRDLPGARRLDWRQTMTLSGVMRHGLGTSARLARMSHGDDVPTLELDGLPQAELGYADWHVRQAPGVHPGVVAVYPDPHPLTSVLGGALPDQFDVVANPHVLQFSGGGELEGCGVLPVALNCVNQSHPRGQSVNSGIVAHASNLQSVWLPA